MKKNFFVLAALSLFTACSSVNDIALENFFSSNSTSKKSLVNLPNNSNILNNRFSLPNGFIRILPDDNFARFISKLKLTPIKQIESSSNPYAAIIDVKMIDKKEEYTTNAAFRLYYEYLYQEKEFDKIQFNQNKNISSFIDFSKKITYQDFIHYLEYAFGKLDYNSLGKYTTPISIQNIRIGDVFYHDSYPKSNAVVVMDLIEDLNGNKMMLLGQGLGTKNQIHILNNTDNPEISPWFMVKKGTILTPEWRFHTDDLVRFK